MCATYATAKKLNWAA